ncbi:DUF4956 domain-containing protein [Stieleria sp. TO1_6]|uniref:DUF4956 domain-containing protein n=1 Tax=Stieleria tagensis TaxID=2956795 RepID=UPI00209B2196|nr:DUF4956 domain-containing protein [Stieleria tagensis]MCO8122002.1 DUF4956 domain-containing protein [Stieleria tagensis]
MPEWFTTFSTTDVHPAVPVLATRLVLAWFCGYLVALLARSKKPAGTPDTLTLTLVLMSILIAMATQIIGDNIARAFSLVGALSIVRFRTAVPATRDVAFVLAAVVGGMAIGAGQYWVAAIGMAVVALATYINSPSVDQLDSETDGPDGSDNWRLTMQVGLSANRGWEPELQRLSKRFQLISAETTRRGAAMELVYRIWPQPETNPVELIAAINTLPMVESVATKVL